MLPLQPDPAFFYLQTLSMHVPALGYQSISCLLYVPTSPCALLAYEGL